MIELIKEAIDVRVDSMHEKTLGWIVLGQQVKIGRNLLLEV